MEVVKTKVLIIYVFVKLDTEEKNCDEACSDGDGLDYRGSLPQCSPRECFVGIGKDYRGFKKTTISGRKCQNWASQDPHKPCSRCTPTSDDDPILQSNYCRNPDDSAEPWCYTMDRNERWEYC